MEFRKLKADEIEVRVASVKENGVSLLLYKDARCDMRILDETVGAENWTRSHELINGNLFCNVGIKAPKNENRDFSEWVFKQDVGTESNSEKEKGQASDSFKRACFNWGIGRELYTAPFIWITADKCKITQNNGRLSCHEKFKVKEIGYEGNSISKLTIVNKNNAVVYFFGSNIDYKQSTKIETNKTPKSTSSQHEKIKKFVFDKVITGAELKAALKHYELDEIYGLSKSQADELITSLNVKRKAKENA